MAGPSPEKTVRSPDELGRLVEQVVAETSIVDVHTHLYSPPFGGLLLWGIDDLVSYHYLIAEVLRTDRSVTPADFWAMDPEQRAEHIWQGLFVEDEPISEARRGVLTVLQALGLPVGPEGLQAAREYFRDVTVADHVDTVLRLANVESVVMTNDPFDDAEREVWENAASVDPRFRAAMRIDVLLNTWQTAAGKLQAWGYDVRPVLDEGTCSAVRGFLAEWADRMAPVYLAVSLPDDFAYPADDARSRLIGSCVLPICEERGVPFAMMVGVRRAVNPELQLAGDGVGKFDVGVLEGICRENPGVRFLVTLLSRENQHELCVAARKFPNLMPFGCWWFLNDPSLILEITRMRVELLGLAFIPQHSDARILDQLIYKWSHSRELIVQVLKEKYVDLLRTGWPLSEGTIRRDVARLLRGNFAEFAGVDL